MERVTVDLKNGEQLEFYVQQKFSPQYLHAIRQHCLDRDTCVIGVRAWPTEDNSEDRNQWAIDQGITVHVSQEVPPEPEPVKEKPKKKETAPKKESEPEPVAKTEDETAPKPSEKSKELELKPEPEKVEVPVKDPVKTKPAAKKTVKATAKKKAPTKETPKPKSEIDDISDDEPLI